MPLFKVQHIPFTWSLSLPSSFTEHKYSNNMVRSPTLLINKSLILVEASDKFLKDRTPGVGDGQGGLACCDSWGRKESNTTEQLI